MNYIIEASVIIILAIIIFLIFKLSKKSMKICSICILLTFILGISYIFFDYATSKPKIQIIGDKNLILEVNQPYIEQGAIAKYHFKDVSSNIVQKNNININKTGQYKVQYEITCDNKTILEERTVEVIDKIKPIITLEGDSQVYATTIEKYKELGFKAEDNYDGDITQNVIIDTKQITENLYQKIYCVKDSSGNICEAIRQVEIKDVVPPELTLNGNETQTVFVGGVYDEKGAKAIDDLDGDITSKIIISGEVNTNKIGTYEITYTVTDTNKNTSTKTRKIRVEEKPTNATGVIYLTFDDGPSATITPKILDILKSENVKATFFILNYSDANAHLVKRIVDEGHTIAIHGYSHDYNQIYQSEEAYMNNLKSLREKIKITTGVDTVITRFPGGSSNTVSKFNPGIMTKLTTKVLDEGYRYFDWNISSGDAGGASTSQEVYNNVIKGFSHKKSNVVLMHDFSGNTKTLNALRDIIHYGKNNGYTFDKITRTTPMVTHRVNN